MVTKLPTKYLVGVEFFRFPDLKSLDVQGYFDCIKILRLLLKSSDFKDSTPGFYINYITVPDDNLNSLRMTYYTIDPAKTQAVIRKFVNENAEKVALVDSRWTSRPDINQKLETFGGEELSFRNFLNRNTQIVLDLLESYGERPLQKLVLEYRHIYLPLRVVPEFIFEPVFSQHSNYLKQLKDKTLDREYWDGLVYSFHGDNFGLHFLVNMIIPRHESAYDPRFFSADWYLR